MPDNTQLTEFRSFLEQQKVIRNRYTDIVKRSIGNKAFDYLHDEIQTLLINTEIMSSLVRNTTNSAELGLINDYSFLVFPAARAYEGFLKQLAVHVGFTYTKNKTFLNITDTLLKDNPDFGIGLIFNEAVNPNIKTKLVDAHRSKNHPNFMKAIWDKCRCDVLHYDYKKFASIRLDQSVQEINMIYQAIRWGYEGYIGEAEYSLPELMKTLKIPPLPNLK